MSVIDEKILQMAFDNGNFEKNIAVSQKSLDMFKKSLDFSNVTTGLSTIAKTISNSFDFSGVTNGIQGIGSQFSALESIAFGFFSRIGIMAFDAGRKMVEALTIDPIKTGFREYETQINAVQTILANTSSKGTTLDQVNEALDELNVYADKTIYNFTQMTKNIGTFTAAGVDLETSTKAIKGIANLAAVSGSTSEQASRAMYQLSQAIAAGRVNLQDWNSVVNAGMGGTVFQNALMETAEAMGIAVDRTKNFRETISAKGDGWLTSDVLLKTLEKFTGDMTEAELAAQGYSKSQIKSIMKMGETANDAATKVKTFTQLWETTTEFVQSGWTQSWEYVIGDFEEAKELLTSISKAFEEILGPSIEARNNVLKFWHDMGGRDKLVNAINNSFEALKWNLAPITNAFNDILPALSGQKLMRISTIIEDISKKLKLPEKELMKLEIISRGLFSIVDILIMGIKSFLEAVKPDFESLSDEFDNILTKVTELSRSIWNFRDELKKNKGTDAFFGKIVTGISKLFKMFPNLSGRFASSFTVIKNVLGDVYGYISEIFSRIGNALKFWVDFGGLYDIFLGLSNVVGALFYNIQPLLHVLSSLFEMPDLSGNKMKRVTTAFLNFSKSLKLSTQTMLKLESIGHGFIAFIEIIIETVKAVAKAFSPLIKEISGPVKGAFSNLGDFLLSAASKFSSYLIRLRDDIKKNDSIYKSITEFVSKIKTFFTRIYTATDEMLKKLTGLGIEDVVSGILSGISNLFVKFWNIIDSVLSNKAVADIFDFLLLNIPIVYEHLIELAPVAFEAIGRIAEAIGKLWRAFVGNGSMEDVTGSLGLLNTLLVGLTVLDIRKFVKDLPDTFSNITTAFTGVPGAINTCLNSISNFFKTMSKSQEEKIIRGIATSVLMLAIAMFILSTIDVPHIIVAFGAIEGLFISLTKAFAAMSQTMTAGTAVKTIGVMGVVIFQIAKSVLVMSIAVAILASLNIGKMWSAVGAITVLMGIIAAMAYLIPRFMKFGTAADALRKSSLGFIFIAVAVLILATAVKKLAKLDIGAMWSAVGAIAVLTAVLVLAARFAESDFGGIIGILLIAVAVSIVAKSVKTLAKIDTKAMWSATIAIGILMLALTGIAALAKNDLGGMIGVLIMAVAVSIVSKAVKKLADIDTKAMWNAVIAIAALMLALTLIAKMASADPKAIVGILVMAIAVIIMASAIAIIATSLKLLSTISVDQMLVAVGGLAALLLIFIGLGALAMAVPEIVAGMYAMAGALLALGAAVFLTGAGVFLLATGLVMLGASYGVIGLTIIALAEAVATAIPIIIDGVLNGLIHLLQRITELLPTLQETVQTLVLALIEAAINTLFLGLPMIIDFVSEFWDENGDSIMEGLKTAWDNFWVWISDNLPIWWANFKEDWSSGWDDIVAQVSIWWNDFWTNWEEGWGDIKDMWTQFWTQVAEKFVDIMENFWDNWKSGGEDIINGIKAGIQWAWDHTLVGYIVGIAGDLLGVFNMAEEIHSPSKKFAESGKMIMAGLQQGIDDGSDSVYSTITDVGNTMSGILTPSLFKNVSDTMYSSVPATLVPDLDATNVYTGANKISSMFASTSFKMADVNGKLVSDNLQYQLDQSKARIYNDSKVVDSIKALGNDIMNLNESMAQQKVYLDTGAMVGAMAGPMDKALGSRQIRSKRGGGR